MGQRILIIDDSVAMQIMLGEMLECLGHQVVAKAGSGAEALKLYPEHKPDLVTLDMSLPDMSGLELLEELLQQYPDIRVVVITANDQKSLERKVLGLGVLGILTKPFQEEELDAVLQKVSGP